MTLKEPAELRDREERLRSEAERAKGAADHLRRQLRDEFGCGHGKEADKMLARLRKEAAAADKEADRAAAEFQEKFGDRMEGLMR